MFDTSCLSAMIIVVVVTVMIVVALYEWRRKEDAQWVFHPKTDVVSTVTGLQAFRPATPAYCKAACESDPNCGGFTITDPTDSTGSPDPAATSCWLKSAYGKPYRVSGTTNGWELVPRSRITA